MQTYIFSFINNLQRPKANMQHVFECVLHHPSYLHVPKLKKHKQQTQWHNYVTFGPDLVSVAPRGAD